MPRARNSRTASRMARLRPALPRVSARRREAGGRACPSCSPRTCREFEIIKGNTERFVAAVADDKTFGDGPMGEGPRETVRGRDDRGLTASCLKATIASGAVSTAVDRPEPPDVPAVIGKRRALRAEAGSGVGVDGQHDGAGRCAASACETVRRPQLQLEQRRLDGHASIVRVGPDVARCAMKNAMVRAERAARASPCTPDPRPRRPGDRTRDNDAARRRTPPAHRRASSWRLTSCASVRRSPSSRCRTSTTSCRSTARSVGQ
jgi:hypothetical protein